jgi:hypothetical protein
MAEHCVKVFLKLSEEFGSEEEREAIGELCEALEDAVESQNVGEFDGDEFGGGQCTLYMYGPSADRLFQAIQKPLLEFKGAPGGYIIKRYGPPKDGIREVRIDL